MDVLATMGALNAELTRDEKITLFRLLRPGKTPAAQLRPYYGLLVQKLFLGRNMDLYCQLLAEITDSSCVMQRRVDKIVHLWLETENKEVGYLLEKLRQCAPPDVYFPPTAQLSVYDAHVPEQVAQRVATEDLDLLVPVYTRVASELQKASPERAAEVLAELLPLARASHTVMLPIQEWVYAFLENPPLSEGERDVLRVLGKYLRFWPKNKLPFMLERVAPHCPWDLWWCDEALQLGGVHAYFRYVLLGRTPPPEWIELFIVENPVGLFLCNKWAAEVPQIKAMIQGEGAYDPEAFSMANNPWLGNVTSEVYTALTHKPSPDRLSEAKLARAGLTVADFCMAVLDKLDEMGLEIENYLV